jgi:hypothetical protein
LNLKFERMNVAKKERKREREIKEKREIKKEKER